jgi:hypothetical protein
MTASKLTSNGFAYLLRTFTVNGAPDARVPSIVHRSSAVPPPIRSKTRSKLFNIWMNAMSGTKSGRFTCVVAVRLPPPGSVDVTDDSIGSGPGTRSN